MGIAGWYSEKIGRIKKLPTPLFILFVSAKALGGVAIGIIVAPYVGAIGWWVMLAALALSIPVISQITKKI